jgi:hypothetical protein
MVQEASMAMNERAALPVQSRDDDEPCFRAHEWPNERHYGSEGRHGSHEVDSAYTHTYRDYYETSDTCSIAAHLCGLPTSLRHIEQSPNFR